PDPRGHILTGNGRGFCAGPDRSGHQLSGGDAPVDLRAAAEERYAPVARPPRAPAAPVAVRVLRVAAGAGADLALAGDIVIATRSASFIQPFCRLGLLPDTGGTFFLPRLVGTARAMGLSLLGDKLSAEQAAQWGLIWECVDDDAFQARLNELAAHFAQAPTKGLAYAKKAIYASDAHSLDQQLDLERDLMRELGASEDYREGVNAFLGKRAPQFKGK